MNTRNRTSVLAVAAALVAAFIYPASADQQLTKKWFPGHYIMSSGSNPDGSHIVENVRNLLAAHPRFVGVRATYHWSELETAFGVYDFSQIIADLDYAHSIGKKVQLMIMDRRFSASSDPMPPDQYPLPAYMADAESIYKGGTYCAFEPANRNFSCWPKMWLVPVAERWAALWTALGAAIDSHPALATVLHAEHAYIENRIQPGFDSGDYLSNLINIHTTASDAFPNTIYIPYFNWHPGLSNAQVDVKMSTLVNGKKVGLGDPDSYKGPDPTTVLTKGYGERWTMYKGLIPFSGEAQRSSYEYHSAREIYDFVVDEIGMNFMIWSPIAPFHGNMKFYFDPDVLAVLNEENFRINTTPPSQLLADGAPILSPENLRVVLD